jgi:hypothetical protein
LGLSGVGVSAKWLRGLDLNQRPLGYEPNELPGCSTPLFDSSNASVAGQTREPSLVAYLSIGAGSMRRNDLQTVGVLAIQPGRKLQMQPTASRFHNSFRVDPSRALHVNTDRSCREMNCRRHRQAVTRPPLAACRCRTFHILRVPGALTYRFASAERET